MSAASQSGNEVRLTVFENRSEYYADGETSEVFEEGICSIEAKRRSKNIKMAFEKGYLADLIQSVKQDPSAIDVDQVSAVAQSSIRGLVDSVTSEVGRALIGLTVMQLCIKAIEPSQNIRLHKSSSSRASFSWKEGISMRTLDKQFVTPILRKNDLVRLNADGFMMTRSLAENYPYSPLYKAKLRGARDKWLSIVEELESTSTSAAETLKFMIALLLNSADEFSKTSEVAVAGITSQIDRFSSRDVVNELIDKHIDGSDYAARLLEIAMHALFQAAVDSGALGDVSLKPLSQMRSANKKHGNIGDVELLEGTDIVESWDAKYGKSYLREELEEAAEKIPLHEHVSKVGFVTTADVIRNEEIDRRISELHQLYGLEFVIVSFREWVGQVFQRCIETQLVSEAELARGWITSYVETLALKRRDLAPIDEPCLVWLRSLTLLIGHDGTRA